MGQELNYCFKCSVRLAGSDFDKGKAFMLGNSSACSACAVNLLPILSPEHQQLILRHIPGAAAMAKSPVPDGLKPSGRSKPSSSARIRLLQRSGGKRSGWIVAVGAAGALVLPAALVMTLTGKKAEPSVTVTVETGGLPRRASAEKAEAAAPAARDSDPAIDPAGGPRPSGGILREVWTDVQGKGIADFLPRLKDPPFQTDVLKAFDCPVSLTDNFGTRVRGYIHPPVTGDYVFYVAGDDSAELWLSTDETPDKRAKIAWTPGFTARQQWEKYPEQRSKPIRLEAWRRYYIEALHMEGIGLDHLSVGWDMPHGRKERPIPGNRLSER